MVNNKEIQLDRVFSALSDSTRREMLLRLTETDMSITELSEPFGITKSAITKHIKILENAGLLRRTVEGRVHRCRLDPEPLVATSQWMTFYKQFWHNKFDALDTFLEKKN